MRRISMGIPARVLPITRSFVMFVFFAFLRQQRYIMILASKSG
jgi:hypothetical protein